MLVAPGSVIQDACKGGKFFGAEFDPADPPEYVKCFGIMKLGREYLLSTQELDIYGTAKAYTGPVRLIHGSKDTIVPLLCSKRFVETYTHTLRHNFSLFKRDAFDSQKQGSGRGLSLGRLADLLPHQSGSYRGFQ